MSKEYGWNNKEVRAHARKALRKNYWAIILVTLVLGYVGIAGTSTFSAMNTESPRAGTNAESTEATSTAEESSESMTGFNVSDAVVSLISGEKDVSQVSHELLEASKGTGGILFSLIYQIDKLIVEHSAVGKLIIILLILIYLVYYLFIKSALELGYYRYLIESQTYSKTPISRLFALFKMKGYLRACCTRFLSSAYIAALFIIGLLPMCIMYFIIVILNAPTATGLAVVALCTLAWFVVVAIFAVHQYFSLIMVPYIIAIEPETKVTEAFKLSRAMMKGEKLHIIGLMCSMIPWFILGQLTFGLLSALFVTPYCELITANVFLKLRNKALDHNYPYSYRLEEEYLDQPTPNQLAQVTLDEKDYDKFGVPVYPLEFAAMEPRRFRAGLEAVEQRDIKRKYTIINLLLLFFIFAFIGWAWEVMLHIVRDGEFVNRGTMHGPWVPIYGVGGVAIIFFLRRFADKPYILFIATMVLCGVIEYFTSYFLELTKDTMWWNYCNYFCNFNGRVCLEGLLAFAFGGMIFVYVAGPALDDLLNRVPLKWRIPIAGVLCVIFCGDLVYSHYVPNTGNGVTDYKYPGYNQGNVFAGTPIEQDCGTLHHPELVNSAAK